MAGINKEPNGRRRLQFTDPNGKRRSVRLGKITKKLADSIKLRVEHILAAQIANHSIDPETARWISELDSKLATKLAKVGLIEPSERLDVPNLGEHLDSYLNSRTDVKPATIQIWGQTVRNLKEFFGHDQALTEITEGDAEEFKIFLISEGLAATTISKRLQFASSFIDVARKKRYIERSPFAEVKSAAGNPKERQYFVSREEIEQVLKVCDPTWRMIITLSRYGGLRCPSEVLSLKWESINWESSKIVVESPKTERHAGKARRTIPIFPELRGVLEEAYELAEPGTIYVIGGSYRKLANSATGWRNANLRSQFKRLIKRAGLTAWPRLFHNMRSSRQTELIKNHSEYVVSRWLGNSTKIARDHYLQITEEDFQKAIEGGAESGSLVVQKAAQHPTAHNSTEIQETTKDPSKPESFASECDPQHVDAKGLSGEDRTPLGGIYCIADAL